MAKKPEGTTVSLVLHLDYEAKSLHNSVRPHMHQLKRAAQKAFKIHKHGDGDYSPLVREKSKAVGG
ncbi:MAG: hypothetical protein E5X80_05025 [Mesorhizobium sp.]|uniref:hypothetical protein n=1 Tax=Mesorhizobium sp. TaxID=1871066 RepID=UPI0011FD0BF1|nr:hypothetical protein [Mesorhizobium sp.]TIO52971.1 MAG: hypothetical protein E5X78_10020 [Mesorhizobium sp.]TIO61804.1 MAG: hypothetical protein E5X79_05400 [Mesorhizobium sp.]TJV66741.1 MAG: hypothetical protein E5X80_05025 [Mesorhizobium sp.]